jgi:hypothetical protein
VASRRRYTVGQSRYYASRPSLAGDAGEADGAHHHFRARYRRTRSGPTELTPNLVAFRIRRRRSPNNSTSLVAIGSGGSASSAHGRNAQIAVIPDRSANGACSTRSQPLRSVRSTGGKREKAVFDRRCPAPDKGKGQGRFAALSLAKAIESRHANLQPLIHPTKTARLVEHWTPAVLDNKLPGHRSGSTGGTPCESLEFSSRWER